MGMVKPITAIQTSLQEGVAASLSDVETLPQGS